MEVTYEQTWNYYPASIVFIRPIFHRCNGTNEIYAMISRMDGKTRQRVVATIGRMDRLDENGQLESALYYVPSARVFAARFSGRLAWRCRRLYAR
jgi:hypothetical protein